MLKAKSLRDESDDELLVKLEALRNEIYQLRSQKLESKSSQSHLVGQKRKEIARILTVQSERKSK